MAKHKNPLEKEFLIRQYKNNPCIKMSVFCEKNNISVGAFQKWIKQYEEGGLEGLARADAEIKEENERLKKNYTVQTNEAGEQEYVRLKVKNSK